MTPEETLKALYDLQEQAEDCAGQLLHAARAVKVSLKTNPLAADLPDALRTIRREADHIKTLAHQLNSALLLHADAEYDAKRPKWKPAHLSPGVRLRRKMMKRGCRVIQL